jgi:hypothetical protein
MLSKFANCISISILNLPIAIFEQINHLEDSILNHIMECGYTKASDLQEY